MAQLSKFGVPGGEMPVLMPKLGYRFRVKFLGFAGEAVPALGTLTSQVVSVGRPSLTTESTTIDVYNSKIKLAGKSTWQDINLVVRDDISNTVARVISAQMGRQMDHAGQSTATAGTNYKFGMVIQTLDGGNDNVQVIDTWSLSGCWLTTVNFNEMNYSTSEAVTIAIGISYDNADYHIGDMPESSLPGLLGDIGGGPGLRALSAGDTATNPN
jgi:hypothetical protein